jgi:hypothetical protein
MRRGREAWRRVAGEREAIDLCFASLADTTEPSVQ